AAPSPGMCARSAHSDLSPPGRGEEALAQPYRKMPRADFDIVESETVPGRPSPLPGGERSDRACAIRVRGKRPTHQLRRPLTRNGRAKPARSVLSPPGRGEEALAQPYRKCLERISI